MDAPATVEAYLAAAPEAARGPLDELRRAVRAAAPQATETIAYGMPAYRVGGRFLVSFAAYKRHFSLFPASDAVRERLGAEVAPYLAGAGTLRFPAGRPIPVALVERMVRIRLEEVAAKAPR